MAPTQEAPRSRAPRGAPPPEGPQKDLRTWRESWLLRPACRPSATAWSHLRAGFHLTQGHMEVLKPLARGCRGSLLYFTHSLLPQIHRLSAAESMALHSLKGLAFCTSAIPAPSGHLQLHHHPASCSGPALPVHTHRREVGAASQF